MCYKTKYRRVSKRRNLIPEQEKWPQACKLRSADEWELTGKGNKRILKKITQVKISAFFK